MSPPNLAERIRTGRKSRSPVQDTVELKYDEIVQARTSGCSYRDIFTQLSREGHNVGKNHTSLFDAFQKVKARRERSRSNASGSAVEGNGPQTPTVSAQASPDQLPGAIIDTRRKTTGW